MPEQPPLTGQEMGVASFGVLGVIVAGWWVGGRSLTRRIRTACWVIIVAMTVYSIWGLVGGYGVANAFLVAVVSGMAGMAAAFNIPIANGGAWPFHNMHLHGGLANGGLVEYHLPAVEACKAIYRNLPQPENGWLSLPNEPGLGFAPDPDLVRECAKLPTARGRGKG